MQKYSRQREAVIHFLQGRTDHPSAEFIYQGIREQYPNISLGTVYRNLAVLAANGQITRIPMEDGVDRFDPATNPHYHFYCRKCNCVKDISLEHQASLDRDAAERFDGVIEGHSLVFRGLCKECAAEGSQ